MRFKKLWIGIVIIIALLGALRLALPYIVMHYVEKQGNKIPGYQVSMRDLDIHLYRGSYVIKDLQLWKMRKKIPVPFFAAESIDLSVQWKALLHGKFVAKVMMERPALNFVTDPRGKNEQLSISDQWVSIAKTLFPLNFNQITLHDGTLSFRSLSGNPPFNIALKKLNLEIKNIQNADRSPESLPSTFHMNARTADGGQAMIQGKFNPFTKKPTFTVNASLKSVNIKTVNNFLRHYTSINAQSGILNFYFQANAANGRIKGYAEPFIKNLQIEPPKTNDPLVVIYNGAAKLAAFLLKNGQTKNIATHVPIEGSIEGPDTSIFSIIGYLLKNAFIEPLLPWGRSQ